MCNNPFVETSETMYFYNKLKRFRFFEPSVGVLGMVVCVIFCFFFLDYSTVEKGLRFSSQNERFNESRKKIDFLGAESSCDVFDGDWVWDESYPLYQSRDCRFMDEGFRCSENGRSDFFYTKWRWQPKNCNLPRFNATTMLEKLQNKRIAFVGDSIGRNQWESLICMLSSVISDKDSIYEVNGNPITKHKGFWVFKFKQYNCTVEYYRAPFLVLQSRPPAKVSSKIKTTIKIDKMDWTSHKWKDVDVLIFNTGHWWNYEKTIRGGCYFQEGSKVKMDMEVDDAYQRSLKTVMDWIHREIHTTKTHVLFRTYAPVHFRGGAWNSGGNCHKETLPELGLSLVPSNTWTKYTIFSEVYKGLSDLRGMDVLYITNLSARRKDAHLSLYFLGKAGPVALRRQDCSHWCLPGVPDTWNELLYAFFLKRELVRTSNFSKFHAQV